MSQRTGVASLELGWLAVSTHPHKERVAIENLVRQSFDAYCPMLRTRVRHARRQQDVLRPMFPGYVFAALRSVQRWQPILSTLGVRTVVRSGERLSFLPSDFVDALRAREIDGAIVRPVCRFSIGQQVKLSGGPFGDMVATIVEMDQRDRLVVLMSLLSRPVRVTVDAASVAAV